MAILKILQYPDLRLRRKGNQVKDMKSSSIQKTIEDMIETLFHQKMCAGLAATQLDIEDPPCIAVINHTRSTDKKNILYLINPIITALEDTVMTDEGCMSIRPNDIAIKVKRANKITVQTLDLQGNHTTFEATGFFAHCIQHEYDHLIGILNIDHVSKLKRMYLERKIAKLAKS